MKITLCAFDAPGHIDGPNAWLKRLIPFLIKNGVELRMLFIAANSKKLPLFNELKEKGVVCRLIPWEMFWEKKIITILEDLQQYPPDLFIPNYFPVACYASKWAKEAGIPALLILHNDDAMHHALVDEFSGSVSAVVCVSKFIADIVKEKLPPAVSLEYITYGAPVPHDTASLPGGRNLKLIYAGRINENQKRISDVVHAMCRTVKDVPGTEAVIYGKGEALDNMLKLLEQEGNGLPVKYNGALNSSDVQKELLRHHVFVLLSEFEGLPIALMEAMACGLVPICTNIKSGVSEVISDGVNGFLIKDRGDAFVNTIRQLKDNPQAWRQCSQKARQTIIDDYSEDACNTKWLTFLKKLALFNTYTGKISVPKVEELKKYSIHKEFQRFDTRMMQPVQLPFYYLKKKVGKLSRQFFQRH